MKFSAYAYLWDLTDRPLRDALTDLKSLGCDSVTLAASYHAGKFLQPRNQKSRVYFPEDGTVYFRPRAVYGEVKPQMSSIVGDTDPYEKIAAQTDVRAWAVLLHNSRLGSKHPHLTVKNAYGDGYVYNLCLSQDSVREYAITLCKDLAENYPIQSIVVETPGFMPYAHGYHHEFSQFPLNTFVETLLGLCFCEACQKRAEAADIDFTSVRDKVKKQLDFQLNYAPDLADSAESWMLYDFLCGKEGEDLGDFINWRSQQVTALVGEIKQGIPSAVSLGCIPSVRQPLGLAWTEGTDYAALAKASDYLELPALRRQLHKKPCQFLNDSQPLGRGKGKDQLHSAPRLTGYANRRIGPGTSGIGEIRDSSNCFL